MTQLEAEFVAREIRNRCLHSSWNDLVSFWQGVMGNLESAYCAAVQNTANSALKDKLAEVLIQLVGDKQVVQWCTETTQQNPPAGQPGADV